MIFQKLTILLFLSTTAAFSDIDDNFDEENRIDVTCQQQNNIGNIQEKMVDLEHGIYTQEILCFLKCRLEKKNYIGPDGTVYPELVKKKIRQIYQNYYKSFDCLESVPPVKACDDVKKIIECIRE